MSDPIEDAVRNLVTLRRLSNGVAKEMRGRVRGLIDAIVAEIARADPTAVSAARYRRARTQKLLDEISAVADTQYPELSAALKTSVAQIGAQQATWAASSLQKNIGEVAVSLKRGIGVQYFRTILREDPFHGELFTDWVTRHRTSTINAVRQQIQIGMAQSETLGDIVRRVRGRPIGGGRFVGGVLRVATAQAEGIARTAINHISNVAHEEVYRENADVLEGVQFSATLDSRTTPICARWDGTVWSLDDPGIQRPPLHFNCRSQLIPVVDWKGLGLEPPPPATRASAGGPVPASQTYEDWFRKLGPSEQNDIIGATRADLFRRGKITFRDMIAKDNSIVRIEDLPI